MPIFLDGEGVTSRAKNRMNDRAFVTRPTKGLQFCVVWYITPQRNHEHITTPRQTLQGYDPTGVLKTGLWEMRSHLYKTLL